MKKTVIVLLMLISIPLFAPVHNELYYEIKKVDINALMREREIDRILTAIKIIESGGDYEAVGQSFEIGAYQFSPSTFEYYSIKFFGEVLDISSPKNQDIVAREKIRWLLDKGWDIESIASFWNCGSPEWEGKVGVNKHGVAYDVPSYVEKFKQIIEGT